MSPFATAYAAAASAAFVVTSLVWFGTLLPVVGSNPLTGPVAGMPPTFDQIALLEVVAGVAFAWLLLGQLPGTLQLAGGALIVAGVIVVKLGERPPASRRRPTRPNAGRPVQAVHEHQPIASLD